MCVCGGEGGGGLRGMKDFINVIHMQIIATNPSIA